VIVSIKTIAPNEMATNEKKLTSPSFSIDESHIENFVMKIRNGYPL
jgi:hypothetical protein